MSSTVDNECGAHGTKLYRYSSGLKLIRSPSTVAKFKPVSVLVMPSYGTF